MSARPAPISVAGAHAGEGARKRGDRTADRRDLAALVDQQARDIGRRRIGMQQALGLDRAANGIAAAADDLLDRVLGRTREAHRQLIDDASRDRSRYQAHGGLPLSGSGRRCARA